MTEAEIRALLEIPEVRAIVERLAAKLAELLEETPPSEVDYARLERYVGPMDGGQ